MFQQRVATDHITKRKATLHKLSILAGVMFISAFGGTLFLLHFIGIMEKYVGAKNEISKENQLRPGTYGLLTSAQCRTVCYKEECIKTAADILEMLDPRVAPCDDFYQYACGGFRRVLTEHKNKEAYMWGVEHETIKFFQDLIRQMPSSVPDNIFGFSITKLRKLYDSCMDLRSLEGNAIPTAIKYLDYFGIRHWPHLGEDYKFNNPDLDETLIRLYFYKLRPLFNIMPRYHVPANATKDFEINAETMQIKLTASSGPIFHSEGTVEAEKVKLMKEILESFTPNDTHRNEILAEILTFDLAIYNVSQRTEERMKRCRTNGTIDCSAAYLYDCAQGGNQKKDRWCTITQNILERSGFSERQPIVPVQLEDGEHFQDLGELIDRTNQRIMAHTFAIHFLMEKAISMNSGLRNKKQFTEESLLKKYFYEMNENRSPFCAMWAGYRLPRLAEMAFYYTIYHNTTLRGEINEIYSLVKEMSLSALQNISWIDSEAKKSLEELFSKIDFYPETYFHHLNAFGVAKFYQEVEVTEESFLANDLESERLDALLLLRNMDVIPKMSGITNPTFRFNPHYSFFPRTIFFDFGGFLHPIVSHNRPRYANIGTIGYVLGHELGHAAEFHITTIEKSEEFENALKERQTCLEKHYSQYDLYSTGEKVKGDRTYSENIADFLGVRAAFKYLKQYQENHGDDEMLPGLQFSNEKMFFIMAAQSFCEENNKESQKAYLRNRHSPPNVRVNALYKNFEAFSAAFDCIAGSPMNPVSKCNFE